MTLIINLGMLQASTTLLLHTNSLQMYTNVMCTNVMYTNVMCTCSTYSVHVEMQSDNIVLVIMLFYMVSGLQLQEAQYLFSVKQNLAQDPSRFKNTQHVPNISRGNRQRA